ncbi:hypothetical protein [Brochothrix campestris]|uniref:Uncharacterized protein n=1 Tax=Brochothrix campestris FSL F6-1037 TaxID=1265861 RepID=W7CA83_9LIST|nr:hypothetical protein [Brochothrix campestris]EUJ34260.1 hypothetical protein BCAMP_12331 [Brochothrix campestris FSL F6-1037]
MKHIRIERKGSYKEFCQAVGEKVLSGYELEKHFVRDPSETFADNESIIIEKRYTAYFKSKR